VLALAGPCADRTLSMRSAGGLGLLLAHQLVAAGEHVLELPPLWPLGPGALVRSRSSGQETGIGYYGQYEMSPSGHIGN
jgi:hypothetical protein